MMKINKQFLKENAKREFKEEPIGSLTRLVVISGMIFMTYGIIAHNGDFAIAYETLKQLIKGVM